MVDDAIEPPDVAALIRGATQADSDSTRELGDVLYRELRRIARQFMHSERNEHTLQPTALANEAFLRLVDIKSIDWTGRAHFLAVAARTMRLVLIDHARKRGAQKRGGDRAREPLHESMAEFGSPEIEILDLEAALEELGQRDARKVRVVEMRFYSGMTAKESAEVLGISPTTVQDDWYAARAWLRSRLANRSARGDSAP